MNRRVHVRVHGRVQGVWFRASAKAEADRLGVVGWVRNRGDGSVELVAEGEPESLSRFVGWCHDGPPTAQVARVDEYELAPVGLQEGFHVRPSD